jgi:hypothetical protein
MLRKVLGYQSGVLVPDLNMPGGPSLASIPRVFDASPDTAVVVLTMEDEPKFAARRSAQGVDPERLGDDQSFPQRLGFRGRGRCCGVMTIPSAGYTIDSCCSSQCTR